jgi:hypothetical protein
MIVSNTKLTRSITTAFLSLLAGVALFACGGDPNEDIDVDTEAASVRKRLNLCVGQVANSFHCIDDTKFQLCTGDGTFVVNSCPRGLCATRHPAIRNPCVGADRAREIDGVPPTPAGQIDDGARAGGGGGNTGGANTGGANTGGANTGGANTGGNNGQCVGGPAFDPAGAKNVGNGAGRQFIGGQCLSAADCASGCCAFPCGICSGPGAQFQAGKQGCGFGG